MSRHRYHFTSGKYISSYLVLEDPDAYIELLESFPCDSKEELELREGIIIRSNDCVNINIPGRTVKQYYLDNREEILKNRKRHYLNNRENLLKIRKKHYLDNRERILKYKKQFYYDQKADKNSMCLDILFTEK
jgi:hypothetical protein